MTLLTKARIIITLKCHKLTEIADPYLQDSKEFDKYYDSGYLLEYIRNIL